MNDSCGHPDPDPHEADALARVNRIRAARGLPPIVERDPAFVRSGLVVDRDAMAVAVAVLHRPGCGATVPDAMDAVLAGKPDVAALDVPPGVALAILNRTPDAHAQYVFDALDAEMARVSAKVAAAPGEVRGLAELCVHRIADATRSAIAAGVGDGLPDCGAVIGGTTVTDGMRAQAAANAAGVVVDGILDRLRDDLLALAGLP